MKFYIDLNYANTSKNLVHELNTPISDANFLSSEFKYQIENLAVEREH